MLRKEKGRKKVRRTKHKGEKYFRAYSDTFTHCFSLDAMAPDENMIAPIWEKKTTMDQG